MEGDDEVCYGDVCGAEPHPHSSACFGGDELETAAAAPTPPALSRIMQKTKSNKMK